MKSYQKTTARLTVKFVKKSTNQVVLTLYTNSMEVYQFFSNEYVDQIMKNTFKNYESIGNVSVVIEHEFLLK